MQDIWGFAEMSTEWLASLSESAASKPQCAVWHCCVMNSHCPVSDRATFVLNCTQACKNNTFLDVLWIYRQWLDWPCCSAPYSYIGEGTAAN